MVSRLCDNFIICDRDKNLQEPELYPCARFGCSIPDSVWRVGRQRNKHTDRNVACSSCTNPELFLNLDWKTTCFKNYLEPTCWKVEVLFCACKIWLIVPSFSLKVAIWQDRPDNCPARFVHDGYERAALDCLPAKSTMTVFPREEINACVCCVVKFVTDSKYRISWEVCCVRWLCWTVAEQDVGCTRDIIRRDIALNSELLPCYTWV